MIIKLASTVILLVAAIVARAETPTPVALKAQLKQVQADTKALRAQAKTLKEANQVPLLVAKLSKAEVARDKTQAVQVTK